MKKEVFIAIIIGFILGLIITFGIYRANQALKQQKTTKPTIAPTAIPSPPAPEKINLEISKPENNLVIQEKKVTVSGQAEPKTAIAFLAENYEDLVLSDEKGLFSAEIPLVGGANRIKVIALAPDGQKQEKTITLVYSTAKIE